MFSALDVESSAPPFLYPLYISISSLGLGFRASGLGLGVGVSGLRV